MMTLRVMSSSIRKFGIKMVTRTMYCSGSVWSLSGCGLACFLMTSLIKVQSCYHLSLRTIVAISSCLCLGLYQSQLFFSWGIVSEENIESFHTAQIVNIIRNLSFEECNAQYMTQHDNVMRCGIHLLLCLSTCLLCVHC